MPIDTLKAAKELAEDDLFTPEQAQRMVETLGQPGTSGPTKEDLGDLEERLRAEINDSEERLGRKIEEHHAATVRAVIGSVAAVGAVLAAVILLPVYLMG